MSPRVMIVLALLSSLAAIGCAAHGWLLPTTIFLVAALGWLANAITSKP